MTMPAFDLAVGESASSTPGRSVVAFALVLFAGSVPLWCVGAEIPLQLLPGLPATTALLVFCPLVAASALVYRESGVEGVKALLKRSFDYPHLKPRAWLAPILLLMPGAMLSSYFVMRAMGVPLPPAQFSARDACGLFIAFLVAAMAEETGWSGYAIDRMQRRWRALDAGILLGLLWSVWHVVPLVQVHRSLTWIAWWFLFTVAGRVLIVWLYNNTGRSVCAAILYHAMSNVSVYLFPTYGSHFDPRITGPLVAVMAAMVAVLWGPRTLARASRAGRR